MKRKISLVALLLLLLTIPFAACNQTTPTERVTRWGDEEYTFNITLADFSPIVTSAFQEHPHDDGMNYYKDFVIQTSAAREVLATEEIRPQDIQGTYTLSIKRDGAYCELTTTQVIYARYNNSELPNNLEELKSCVVTAEEDPFEANVGMTTLKSTTDTYVKFSNDLTQKPANSSIKVNGFYVGKQAQTVSKYEITTEYDVDNKTAKVSKNGGETVTNKLTVADASKFIDANQIIIYARSLDKASAFQDSPSVVVYNPYENKNYTATFLLNLDQNALLKANGANEYLKINTLGIALGNTAFMMQETLPKLENFDTIPNATNPSAPHSKYTMVNFRVGYLSYEISDSFFSAELVQALKDRVAEKK